ncbi:MAG: hypothetical protein L3J22_05010 [Xanthomonadales bacterium]|nr:hypothetical protein [Xanthomonadales bacterium]
MTKHTEKQLDLVSKSPVRDLFMLSALWMPLGFFFWFKVSTVLVIPVAGLVTWLLEQNLGESFYDLLQNSYMLEIATNIPLNEKVQGRLAALSFDVNPMVYGYGIPLIFGLIMATPGSWKKRMFDMLGGYFLLVVVQTWGVFWEVQKHLQFTFLGTAAGSATASELSPTVIALCYQLGYLILPAVVPVAWWILRNRVFLEQHVLDRRFQQFGRNNK